MDKVHYSSAERVSRYHKKRYSTWIQRGLSGREAGIISSILDSLPAKDAILDVPSGYGRFSPLFLARAKQLVSADISFYMLDETRRGLEEAAAEPENIAAASAWTAKRRFVATNAANIALKSKSVDAAFSIRLMQHVSDRSVRVAILRELGRVSRGRVVVSFYRTRTLHVIQRFFKEGLKFTRKHIEFTSVREFEAEAAEAGLKIEKLYRLKLITHSQTFAVLV
jgi:SAM-dependent methyltransferase